MILCLIAMYAPARLVSRRIKMKKKKEKKKD
jgi:hypothetical protein